MSIWDFENVTRIQRSSPSSFLVPKLSSRDSSALTTILDDVKDQGNVREQFIRLEKEFWSLCEQKEQCVINQDWTTAAKLRDETEKLRKQMESIKEEHPEIVEAIFLERARKEKEEITKEVFQKGSLPCGEYAIDTPNMPINRINVQGRDGMPLAFLSAIFIACEKSINHKAHKQGMSVTYSQRHRMYAGSFGATMRNISIYGNLNDTTSLSGFNKIWNQPSDELKKLFNQDVKEVKKVADVIQTFIHELGHDLEHAIENLLPSDIKEKILEAWQAGVRKYYQELSKKDRDKPSNDYYELELIINNPDAIMQPNNVSKDPLDEKREEQIDIDDDFFGQKVMNVPSKMYYCSFKEIMAELYRLHCLENYFQKYEQPFLSYKELVEKGTRHTEEVLNYFEDLYSVLKSNIFENYELLEKIRKSQEVNAATIS